MKDTIKFKLFSQSKMIDEIKKNNKLYDLLIIQRDKYLTNLSKKFINMSIEKIILGEKNYLMSLDKNSKLYYLICSRNNEPVGICKFIVFGKELFKSDFFEKLSPDFLTNRFLYVFGVYVDEKMRGKNLCKKMLEKISLIVKKIHVNLVVADIKDDNSSSIKCFTSSGYKKTNIISRPPDVYFYALRI